MTSTVQYMASEARRQGGATVGIPPRHMRFEFPADADRFCFYGGNSLASSLFAVFSAIFPPGERFFVESVRHFRDRLRDPVLDAQVSGFIGQEAFHGREHEQLNNWFRERGYDMATSDRLIRFSLGLLELLPASQQLACTALMEHFTAELAEEWLTNMEFRAGADPRMLQLWSWHALEELEHKAVAFDVHERVSQQPYAERMLAVPLVAVALLPSIFAAWGWQVVKQGELFNVEEHRRGWKVLFARGGFIKRVLNRMPPWFEMGHHPNDHDTRKLEREWRARLFGAQGELLAQFRNREAVERAAPLAKAG
ncbi:MAG TPA: metal-dependent hydrolase [Moraxellaceae bacterium]|nr:metal-dependent hydrolase [Moraxellaceae bacterium]